MFENKIRMGMVWIVLWILIGIYIIIPYSINSQAIHVISHLGICLAVPGLAAVYRN
jgi:tryptophan-rich sensory protein